MTKPVKAAFVNDADPVLSIAEMARDLNVSLVTFYRVHRPRIPMLALSVRLRGARRSVFERYKQSLELPVGE